MISYAQNREDVLLARALAGTEVGIYIDAGAYDPTIDSVTRHFYDRGWHGINIEPQPAYAAKLREARPRDINLQVALSDQRGTAILYGLSIGDGVATINDTQARRFGELYEISGEQPVTVTTLAAVCAEHCDPGTPISFLKVDVEGHERAVLAGADWDRWQPRIVVVEATEPLSTRPSHASWEPILLAAGYVFAQFDGLNRWYVRRQEPELLESLHAPVNILDIFEPYPWKLRVDILEAQVASLLAAPADGGDDTTRQRALIRSFESLQQRYHRLSDALQEERAHRVAESKELARLTREVELLRPSGPEPAE
ncbi:MAG: FkbM family methyltransferase [Candidatus Dormibacteria bacterium]